LHPAEAQRRKLKQIIFIGEIYLDRLYKQNLRQPAVRELSRFQAVRRDFSFLLVENTPYAHVADALASLNIPELQSCEPQEILREKDSKLVPAGHLSLLLRTVFQAPDRTLQEEELQGFSQRVIAAVESLGGKLRS
jgi:phenylalanyl-tRNA synthetase beta chain